MGANLERLILALGRELSAQQAYICTAESCTGGGIAEALTAVAGSSAWFDSAFVTYSNRAKQGLLGVDPALIASVGAVSEAVVLAMARGACERSGAAFSVAVSGVAGPGGGSADKPVGTVWIAWQSPNNARAQHFLFSGDRASVREQSVMAALRGSLLAVQNYYCTGDQ